MKSIPPNVGKHNQKVKQNKVYMGLTCRGVKMR